MEQFLRSNTSLSSSEAKSKAEEIEKDGVAVDYLEPMFKFLRSNTSLSALEAVAKSVSMAKQPKGRVPVSFLDKTFRFLRSNTSLSALEAVERVLKLFNMSEQNAWSLPSFAELEEDLPRFFSFIRANTSNSAMESVALCERIMAGNGRASLDKLSSDFKEIRSSSSKSASEALEMAFKKQNL